MKHAKLFKLNCTVITIQLLKSIKQYINRMAKKIIGFVANKCKRYNIILANNRSTMMMNMEGNWDDNTKTINFKGKIICPGNGKVCEVREVYKMADDNPHEMEMYGPDMQTGKEYKSMEIKFTRGA